MSDALQAAERRTGLSLAALTGWAAILIGILGFPVMLFSWSRRVTGSGELAVVAERLGQP